MRRPGLAIVVALGCTGGVTGARAADTAYSDRTAFLSAAPGPVSTLDFESLVAGTDLSGVSVGVGSASITFPVEIDDAAGDPGEKLNLRIVDDLGDNPTSSPTQSLGTDDAGNFDALIAGSEIPLSLTPPVSGIGLSIVTPETPGALLFDEEVQLVVPGEPTALLKLSDGQLVGNFDGDDYYEYFVGVISTNPITSATLAYDGATPDGSFLFNVDDVVVVPEPGGTLLLVAGVAALIALARRDPSRRKPREAGR